MAEVPRWDPPSPVYSCQEQNSQWKLLLWNPSSPEKTICQPWHSSNMTIIYQLWHIVWIWWWRCKDNENYATMVNSFVNKLSVQVASANTKRYQGLAMWLEAFNMIYHTTQVVSAQCCICPCLGGLGQVIISYGGVDYCITCTVINCLSLQCLERQWVCTDICHWFWLVMLIPYKAQKWSPLSIVPSLSVGWGATCSDMWQCQRNSPWWD